VETKNQKIMPRKRTKPWPFVLADDARGDAGGSNIVKWLTFPVHGGEVL
jgi:hypothetical protein